MESIPVATLCLLRAKSASPDMWSVRPRPIGTYSIFFAQVNHPIQVGPWRAMLCGLVDLDATRNHVAQQI